MSCIKNMGAEQPVLDVISPTTSRRTSGKATPLTAETNFPATPTSGEPDNARGDPTKRQRPSHPSQNQQRNISMQGDSLRQFGTAEGMDERGWKRRRKDDDNSYWRDKRPQEDSPDDYFAAGRFLAKVDKKLYDLLD
jgi:hypothetical protein